MAVTAKHITPIGTSPGTVEVVQLTVLEKHRPISDDNNSLAWTASRRLHGVGASHQLHQHMGEMARDKLHLRVLLVQRLEHRLERPPQGNASLREERPHIKTRGLM